MSLIGWLLLGCASPKPMDTDAVEECPLVCEYISPHLRAENAEFEIDWSNLDRAVDGTPMLSEDAAYFMLIHARYATDTWACTGGEIALADEEFLLLEIEDETSADFSWWSLYDPSGFFLILLLDESYQPETQLQSVLGSILMYTIISPGSSSSEEDIEIVFPEDYPSNCLP